MEKLNLTEPSRIENPLDGDYMQYTLANGAVVKKAHRELVVIDENEFLVSGARDWRDEELYKTDYIVPLTDHPDHASTLAYRAALRDWPSTSDFPDTKPTL